MTHTSRGYESAGPASARPEVEIRRSARRRRTISARLEGDTFVVLMPAGLSQEEEQQHVDNLLGRHLRAQARRRLEREDLMARAMLLSERYLDGRARPASITWVTNQQKRWGSCSPTTRTIRLSTELEGMPAWVVDSVILHELAHLLEPNHGPRFKALVGRDQRYAESTAFLRGVAFATGREMSDDDGDLEPG
ncbi:M48 family metallopeptidase [Ornithinimicrobium sp. F0845]|uniref:M48 metallopeptidase family protein n=1 Tax=Ornithinimicrobium sp. F0845 TaxID=2926412 RepID=UPI001FF376E7|nr:M48 family metallopeptidase [Ornithinimicrobium sp. F0845]MCK0111106.1 M48 family metallopeptidase [Ornithinimicrobium sp. F0845]